MLFFQSRLYEVERRKDIRKVYRISFLHISGDDDGFEYLITDPNQSCDVTEETIFESSDGEILSRTSERFQSSYEDAMGRARRESETMKISSDHVN